MWQRAKCPECREECWSNDAGNRCLGCATYAAMEAEHRAVVDAFADACARTGRRYGIEAVHAEAAAWRVLPRSVNVRAVLDARRTVVLAKRAAA